MKALKWIGAVSVILAIVFGFWGCEKMRAPIEPTYSIKGKPDDVTPSEESSDTHWEAEKIIKYNSGGILKIDKLFSLKVKHHSMSTEEDTEIFGEADILPDGSLRFHFEPHSLKFNSAAELALQWHKLDVGEWETINLYYFEPTAKEWILVSSSNDEPGRPKWNKKNKIVWFEIEHFSIYALSKD